MASALSLREAFTAIVLAWAFGVPAATRAQQVNIETGGQGDIVTVNASVDLPVDPRTVWSVIADYDHLAEYIPDMRSSRVMRRNGDQVVVEQKGVFGFLFVQQPVEVKLDVVESPPRRIVAHAIGGNLREMDGRYELERMATGAIRLSYFGRVVPAFPVAPILGRMVVRSVLTNQFTALVKEILRRDALAKAAPYPP